MPRIFGIRSASNSVLSGSDYHQQNNNAQQNGFEMLDEIGLPIPMTPGSEYNQRFVSNFVEGVGGAGGSANSGAQQQNGLEMFDEIGLPVMTPPQMGGVGGGGGMAMDEVSVSSTGTVWDEIEESGRSSSVPQDPTPVSNIRVGVLQMGTEEQRRASFNKICEELLFTLASRVTGYTNLQELGREFSIDTGYIPDVMAREFGFENFEQIIHHERLRHIVKVDISEDNPAQPVYLPRDCAAFAHIRSEQETSNHITVNKEEDEEREKLARALTNENAYVEGKKVILKLLYELGGENNAVFWVRIQQKYNAEYGRELNGDELRKYFQRDKALKIITKFFHNEVEAFECGAVGGNANSTCGFALKLRKPYSEIMRHFDEVLRQQREAAKIRTTNNRRPMPSKKNMTLEDRFQPTRPLFQTIDPCLYAEQSTSASITNNNNGANSNSKIPLPPPASQIRQQPTTTSTTTSANIGNNNTSIVNSGGTNAIAGRSKFEIPTDVLTSVNGSATSPPDEPANARNGAAFDWNAEPRVPIFEPVGGGGLSSAEPSTNAGGGNGSDSNNNNRSQQQKPKSSQQKYTTRTNTGNYTDSEAEESGGDEADDDKSTIVGDDDRVRPSVTVAKPPPMFANSSANPLASVVQRNVAPPPTTPYSSEPVKGHQKVIQDHMRTQMALRGLPTSSSAALRTSNPTSSTMAQAQQPLTLTVGVPPPPPLFQPQQQQHQQQTSMFTSNSNPPNRFSASTSVNGPPPPSIAQSLFEQPRTTATAAMPTASSSATVVGGGNNSVVGGGENPFLLLDYVETLRELANRRGYSHETRREEGSFAFRRGNTLVTFTEFNQRVRITCYKDQRIYDERYLLKNDWTHFYATVLGFLDMAFGDFGEWNNQTV